MIQRKTVREVIQQSVSPDEASVLPAVRSRAPARDALGKWQPGQSANPGGRPKETADYKTCRLLARDISAENTRKMNELANTTEDDRVQYMARDWIDQRAWGKPKDYDLAEDRSSQFDLLRLSPEQREELRRLLELAKKPREIGSTEPVSVNDTRKS